MWRVDVWLKMQNDKEKQTGVFSKEFPLLMPAMEEAFELMKQSMYLCALTSPAPSRGTIVVQVVHRPLEGSLTPSGPEPAPSGSPPLATQTLSESASSSSSCLAETSTQTAALASYQKSLFGGSQEATRPASGTTPRVRRRR